MEVSSGDSGISSGDSADSSSGPRGSTIPARGIRASRISGVDLGVPSGVRKISAKSGSRGSASGPKTRFSGISSKGPSPYCTKGIISSNGVSSKGPKVSNSG